VGAPPPGSSQAGLLMEPRELLQQGPRLNPGENDFLLHIFVCHGAADSNGLSVLT